MLTLCNKERPVLVLCEMSCFVYPAVFWFYHDTVTLTNDLLDITVGNVCLYCPCYALDSIDLLLLVCIYAT